MGYLHRKGTQKLRWFMFQNSNFEPTKVREDHLNFVWKKPWWSRIPCFFPSELHRRGLIKKNQKHLTLCLEVQLSFWKFPLLLAGFLTNFHHEWLDCFAFVFPTGDFFPACCSLIRWKSGRTVWVTKWLVNQNWEYRWRKYPGVKNTRGTR